MLLKGKAHKYGADVNTDVIIPARYLNTTDPVELGRHCMEDLDPEFVKVVKPGDIIVATTNFGCGSSREHAPIALKAAGVSCIVASSFARIFFRNAINLGIPAIECPEAVEATQPGDQLQLDLAKGEVHNLTRNKTFKAKPYEPFMLELIQSGGLIEYTRQRLAAQAKT